MFINFKYFFIMCFVLLLNCLADIQNDAHNNIETSSQDIIEVYKSNPNFLPSGDKIQETEIISKVNNHKQRVSFNLPDAFYFIGAPIFLFILLRLVATFIQLFEDERNKDLKKQSFNDDKIK